MFGWFEGDLEWFEGDLKWFGGDLGGLRKVWNCLKELCVVLGRFEGVMGGLREVWLV